MWSTLLLSKYPINYGSVFDRDNDGFITRDELKTAMEMIGETLNETQLTEMLNLADLDKDGQINYEGECEFNSCYIDL